MSVILSWEKLQPAAGVNCPISREGHSLTYIEDKGIILFGGFGALLSNEMFLYLIEENRWELITYRGLQPSPRCYHTAFHFGTLLLT